MERQRNLKKRRRKKENKKKKMEGLKISDRVVSKKG